MSDITTVLQVSISVHAPINTVWEKWTNPEDIMQRNFASPDWECPKATNDVRDGWKFNFIMAAKDGSFSFDFYGKYTNVEKPKLIEYRIWDWRMVSVMFEEESTGSTKVTERFEAEKENPPAMQQAWWQTILDNFKKHVETWA